MYDEGDLSYLIREVSFCFLLAAVYVRVKGMFGTCSVMIVAE